MRKTVTYGVAGVAGAVAAGLMTFQGVSAFAQDDLIKRDEDTIDVVTTVDDEDDDDTFGRLDRSRDTRSNATRSKDTRSKNTGNSRSKNDNTNSRFTKVSRDRDISRGDKTRDWTKDGEGKKKRDWSADRTNDKSRNDTRR